MAFKMRALLAELNRRKPGIIIGALVGVAAAWYSLSKGYDLTQIANAGKGLLDTLMSRSAPIEVAKYKVYIMFATVGAVFGYLADLLIARLGLIRRRR